MPRKKFRCSRCKRTFSMAAHLARHKSAKHAPPGKRAARRKTGKPKVKRRVGRPKKRLSAAGLRASMRAYFSDLTRRRATLESQIAAIETAMGALQRN